MENKNKFSNVFAKAKETLKPIASQAMDDAKKYAKEKAAPAIKKALEDSADEVLNKAIPTAKEATKKAANNTKKFAQEKAIPTAKKVASDTKTFVKEKAIPATKETAVKAKDTAGKIIEKAKSTITEEQVADVLNKLYIQSVNGIDKVSVPVEDLVKDYLTKNKDVETAAKSLVQNSIVKCGTSGFLSNLGGFATLIVGLPANLTSVMYVQIRMCAAIAAMGGYDVHSDQVQTMIYACLTGSAMTDIVKNAGIKFGQKFSTAMIKKIPGAVLTKINQAVGFRFVTKFGEKGIVNLVDAVPVVGGVIGGGIDIASTSAIGKNAISVFINGEVPNKKTAKKVMEDIPIDVDFKSHEDLDDKTLEKAINSK